MIDALCEGCRRALVTEAPRESEGPVLCGRCRGVGKAQSLLVDPAQFAALKDLPIATKPLPFGLRIIEADWMPPGAIMGVGADGKSVFVTGVKE